MLQKTLTHAQDCILKEIGIKSTVENKINDYHGDYYDDF